MQTATYRKSAALKKLTRFRKTIVAARRQLPDAPALAQDMLRNLARERAIPGNRDCPYERPQMERAAYEYLCALRAVGDEGVDSVGIDVSPRMDQDAAANEESVDDVLMGFARLLVSEGGILNRPERDRKAALDAGYRCYFDPPLEGLADMKRTGRHFRAGWIRAALKDWNMDAQPDAAERVRRLSLPPGTDLANLWRNAACGNGNAERKLSALDVPWASLLVEHAQRHCAHGAH